MIGRSIGRRRTNAPSDWLSADAGSRRKRGPDTRSNLRLRDRVPGMAYAVHPARNDDIIIRFVGVG